MVVGEDSFFFFFSFVSCVIALQECSPCGLQMPAFPFGSFAPLLLGFVNIVFNLLLPPVFT